MSRDPAPTETYLESAIRKLEFDKVRERITALTRAEPSRLETARIRPLRGAASIRRSLSDISTAKRILLEDHDIPLHSFRDVTATLKRSTVDQQALSAQELLDTCVVLRMSREMHAFLKRRMGEHPVLASFVERLCIEKILEFNIDQAIDTNGDMKDGASKKLAEIRRNMTKAREQLQRRLTEILKRVSKDEFTQDDIITTRDGRLVIPIKTEFKHRVEGFIHSTSASGATVYIEPTESLELNNALRELQLAEHREIHAILVALTAQVGESSAGIGASMDALIELDVLFAKARYSIEILGEEPVIASEPVIRVQNGRHPMLLQRLAHKDVVPISIELVRDRRTLVITGPNAGGKSVALKTVGLLSLCAMCGLHVSASADSEFYPFEKIWIDMGDEQSLEQDLSTFSSHLAHLKNMLRASDRETLVLIDEIGTGTDPVEGSALAEAILLELTARGALTIATTHHSSLKAFAHSTVGMMNGSMEFDTVSLLPTYRFLPGVPGSSFALELAQRIGLPASVLAGARSRIGSRERELETLLQDVHRLKTELERKTTEANEHLSHATTSAAQYEEKLATWRSEYRQLRKKAIEEAEAVVKEGRRTLESTIREVRETQADKETVKRGRGEVEAFRERIEKERESVGEESHAEPEDIRPGDRVQLRSSEKEGEVVSLERKKATVLVGSLRIVVPLTDVTKIQGKKKPETVSSGSGRILDSDATREVDVRGMYLDEAVSVVERALDRAMVAGLFRVDIVHGKGTGALRSGISEYLRTSPYVRSFRPGEWNEGGTGVTIVEIGGTS